MTLSNPTTDTLSSRAAQLHWDDTGTPVSSHFNDVYFSKVSGMDETRHVFLRHNHLEKRFQSLTPECTFTISETGFGTGLNFLCAWQLFEQTAPEGSQLHFISTEKYPLNPKDMQQALTLFPELEKYTQELNKHYRLTDSTQLTLALANGRVTLSLLLGDALDRLPDIKAPVDAWFLDGFAPAKNPDMWQPTLFQTMASKSTPTTTYATFTAASTVRQGLAAAGFSVIKSTGFGNKRDMLFGEFRSSDKPPVNPNPWFTPSAHRNPDQSAIVIGGGMAGTSCARSLAERGWKVQIIERHNQLAAEASGNPQGVLYAKLSADNTPLSRFILQGYRYTLDLLKQFKIKEWQPCGIIQLAINEKIAKRYQALDQQHPDCLLQYLKKQQLSDIAGLPIEHDGLFFPEAGWVNPPSLCRALADHPNITLTTNTAISRIQKTDDGWQLFHQEQCVAQTETLIIAEGTSSQQLPQLQHLPLKAIRGQVTRAATTATSQKLSTCVCGDGYIAPATDGYHTLGATFNFKDDSSVVTEKDHKTNLGMQSHWFPAMYEAMGGEETQVLDGRVGFRCTTPDYLPVVGAIVDYPRFIEQYAPLRKNKKHRFSDSVHYLDGLYISAGHGSRGTISCPLSGEILASMITGETSPLDESLQHHINPTRFLVRDLARNKI